MEQKRQGRVVNAATLGKNKLTREERKVLYEKLSHRNKYVEAFSKTQGCIVVHDPAFML